MFKKQNISTKNKPQPSQANSSSQADNFSQASGFSQETSQAGNTPSVGNVQADKSQASDFSKNNDFSQPATAIQPDQLEQLLLEVQDQLTAAQEKERRAIADYQNLLRRTQEERAQLIKFANRDFLLSLIEPLENLNRSAQQLNDQGLKMVVEQLKQALIQLGVEIIDPMGMDFDLELMEATDKKQHGKKVISVLQRAYKLNDQVVAHAKVGLD